MIDATLRSHTPEVKLMAALVAVEEERRKGEKDENLSLADFESTYFGTEVGFIRRAFNEITTSKMRTEGTLLDFGCGGSWWKEDYWPKFSSVTAVEVNKRALEDLQKNFNNVVPAYTSNGLIDPSALKTKGFDVVLSSSVVGYILPIQAEHHLRCCFELLKPGGQLVLTRVRAYTFYDALRSKRLSITGLASFSYGYTVRELITILKSIGFENLDYTPLGIRLPLPMKINQALYRIAPRLFGAWLPRLFPFLKIQHCFTATRPL